MIVSRYSTSSEPVAASPMFITFFWNPTLTGPVAKLTPTVAPDLSVRAAFVVRLSSSAPATILRPSSSVPLTPGIEAKSGLIEIDLPEPTLWAVSFELALSDASDPSTFGTYLASTAPKNGKENLKPIPVSPAKVPTSWYPVPDPER